MGRQGQKHGATMIRPSIAAWLLLASTAAWAQPSQDIATDKELFAAYCVGKARADEKHEIHFPDPKIDEWLNRPITEEAQSFRNYLIARGYFYDRSASALLGVNVAVRNGFSDGEACWRDISDCVTRCQRQKSCMNQCVKSSRACAAGVQCDKPVSGFSP